MTHIRKGFDMTDQEIFDTVARHLLKQGRPASKRDGACFYRTDDGLKCAAGVLIPDEDYSPWMENQPADQLSYFRSRFSRSALKLIQACQSAHDLGGTAGEHAERGTWLREWKDQMQQIAREFHLDPAILEKEDA